jgi:hypothetical protein
VQFGDLGEKLLDLNAVLIVLSLELFGHQQPIEARLALLHQNRRKLMPERLDLSLLCRQGVLETAILSQEVGVVPEDNFGLLLELVYLAGLVLDLGVLDIGLEVLAAPLLGIQGGSEVLG